MGGGLETAFGRFEEKEFSGLLPNGSTDLTMTVSFPRFFVDLLF